MHGEVEVGADTAFPAGPLNATVGIRTGAKAGYERWVLRPADTPARNVVAGLYSGLRLPQQIDSIEELPEPGELLVYRFGGYLHLTAGLKWGYSLEGARDLDVPKLDASIAYRVKAMAELKFGYRLAGDYQIEARRGHQPDWVRFVVRKSRESQTTLAADFGLDADLEVKGLPDSADEFLSTMLGTDADRALDLFGKARQYTDLSELQKIAGTHLKAFLSKYAEKALGMALKNETFQEFLSRMRAVTDTYANLDSRIVGLYKDIVRRGGDAQNKAIAAMDIVLGKSDRQDFLALGAGDADSSRLFTIGVDLLRRIYNERIFEVLSRNDRFDDAVKLLARARPFVNGEVDQPVKHWIDMLQAEFPPTALLQELAKYDTPPKIRGIADEKLQGLVELLCGRAFKQLRDTDIADLLNVLKNNLDRINNFKDKWYARIKGQLRQSFEAKLHVAYARARRNERMLDVEVNLSAADGPRLARAAAHGDFAAILDHYDPNVTLVNQGFLTEELEKSLELKVKVMGWNHNGLITLFQESEHAIEPQGGGLLHVYTSRASVERKEDSGWRFREEMCCKFLVEAVGQTFQPAGTPLPGSMIDAISSVTSEYNMLQKDQRTSVHELAGYLGLASAVGLLQQDPVSYASELERACGGELGLVNVSYVVRFDQPALRHVFNLAGASDIEGGELGKAAREAMRCFMARKAGSMAKTDWYPRVLFAYSSERAYQLHRAGELLQGLKAVTLPAWYLGEDRPREMPLSREMVILVDRLFRFEDSLVRSLVAIDEQVESVKAGRKLDVAAMDKAVRALVDAASKVGDYDASCFSAIIDALAYQGSRGAVARDSAVILDVTPREGALSGQKVTRYLACGPKNPTEIAVDKAVEKVALAVRRAR
jgi:hypothetical protein